MRRLLAIAALCAALAIAACGDDDEDETPPDAAPAAETTTEDETQAEGTEKASGGDEKQSKPKPGTEIKVASSQFGSVLFDADDQVIYLFDKEKSDKSECYGDCAAEWPPVLTKGDPAAGKGTDAELLGTTERDDGSTQVTYNGHPLYYYAHEGPGEVRCHNVSGFGGLWLVVQPSGDPAA